LVAAGGVVWAATAFSDGDERSLAIEDIDRDGQLEIVVGNAGSVLCTHYPDCGHEPFHCLCRDQ